MRKLIPAGLLVGAVLSLGVAGTQAAMMKTTVKLHPPAHGMSMTMHAFGSAKIGYTAHDADIKLTTDNLPAPAALHEGAYVLWLVNGMHKVNAGALHVTGNMAGLHAMTMDVAFTKLVVTAEKSATVKDAMGPKVLVGAVMHH